MFGINNWYVKEEIIVDHFSVFWLRSSVEITGEIRKYFQFNNEKIKYQNL